MKGNTLISIGLLLLSAAIILGDMEWIPHGWKLFLMGFAVALELWGMNRKCREKREENHEE